MAKLNVEGLAEKVDLKGKNVLMRVDLNVPLSKEVRMKSNITFIDELTINGVFVHFNGNNLYNVLEDSCLFLTSFLRLCNIT